MDMDNTIKFEIKEQNNLCSVMIYRGYDSEDGKINWGYVDSLHPMSRMELHTLKNFLQEYIHNNDWY